MVRALLQGRGRAGVDSLQAGAVLMAVIGRVKRAKAEIWRAREFWAWRVHLRRASAALNLVQLGGTLRTRTPSSIAP